MHPSHQMLGLGPFDYARDRLLQFPCYCPQHSGSCSKPLGPAFLCRLTFIRFEPPSPLPTQLHHPLWQPMPIVWPVYCTYGPSILLAHTVGLALNCCWFAISTTYFASTWRRAIPPEIKISAPCAEATPRINKTELRSCPSLLTPRTSSRILGTSDYPDTLSPAHIFGTGQDECSPIENEAKQFFFKTAMPALLGSGRRR